MAQDFRGYLQTADPAALAYTGNDARIDPTKAGYETKLMSYDNSGTSQKAVQDYISGLYGQYQASQGPKTVPSIYGASGGGAPAPVYAPKLDVASINAQARTAAEGAVNPFYTKQLNDFLAQQSAQKLQQQTQHDTNIQNLQDTLKNTLDANALTQTRTGEDAALKQQQTNTANDQNQVDTGNQFETDRLAAAKAQATAGVLGTGAGNRATGVATGARNTTEDRQNQAFQQTRDQTELFKTRTFADLAKSGELATTSENKGEKQANFDLDSYIKNAAFTEQDQRNKLEEARLQRIGQETGSQAKLLFNKYLAGISNPAQYEAAVRTYGGSF